jgi:hypothetical protein
MYVDPHSAAENGDSDKVQFAQYPREIVQPQPFSLKAPPIKITGATPKVAQDGFDAPARTNTASPPLSPGFQERQNEHVGATPGEQTYAAVPIPGAYTPLASPSYPPPQSAQGGFDFGPGVTGTR